MPETVDQQSARAKALERKLRFCKKQIVGISEAGKSAVSLEKVREFRQRLKEAEAYWNKFQDAWDERDALKDYIEQDEFPTASWNELFDAITKEMRDARISLSIIEERPGTSGPPLDSSHVAFNASAFNAPKSNLPKIAIPRFSGDLLKWTQFKDTFESIVHNEPRLTNIERFHYLLGALAGEPATLISGFAVEDVSYPLAWDKLLRTYDNKRVLANLYVQRILDCNARSLKAEEQRYDAFLSSVADSIEAFRRLKIDDAGEFLLSILALRALDAETRRSFELSRDSTNEFPKADEVIDFVTKRMHALKMARDLRYRPGESSSKRHPNQRRVDFRTAFKYDSAAFHASSAKTPERRHQTAVTAKKVLPNGNNNKGAVKSCPFCHGNHVLRLCGKFVSLTGPQRIAFVGGWKGCSNCLYDDHASSKCRSKLNCRYCGQRHHSLLHQEDTGDRYASPGAQPHPVKQASVASDAFIGFGSSENEMNKEIILLGTMKVLVKNEVGEHFHARALLDSGSQHTFITSRLAHKIGSPLSPFHSRISGLGGSTVTQPSGYLNCILSTCTQDIEYPLRAVVVDSISHPLPNERLDPKVLRKLPQTHMADPRFSEPGPIDLLIGVDLYPQLVTGAPSHSGVEDLYLLPTVFGTVIIGRTSGEACYGDSPVFLVESISDIENQIKRFWEIEEPATVNRQDPKDKYCEEHFLNTYSRDLDGRYIVEMPIAPNTGPLGKNRTHVIKRFLTLEQKMQKNNDFGINYRKFMQEYIELNHMSPAISTSPYLIPHHGVWQQRPGGSKLRVVFDASCPSTNLSLNDTLLPGPKLQADLGNILINFRRYTIPLCADLVKMYRQILLSPSQRHMQHVLWRSLPCEQLQEFELNTVTYGIRPSAFLAMRVIRQLVDDEGSKFPLASEIIRNSMYVDDIVGGAHSIQEAVELKQELISLFSKGGFTLSKWASTIPELVPDENPVSSVRMREGDNEVQKILGLIWIPPQDAFAYEIRQPLVTPVTKRTILSSVARIFDPLGLLAPVIFKAKTLLQELWKCHLDWDDPIPDTLEQMWRTLVDDWRLLGDIRVPRHMGELSPSNRIVGFCDASERGYAAAVYITVQSKTGEVKATLLMAKTKVAPLKFVSVARLELCGALLLARLLSSMNTSKLTQHPPACFSDSAVVLSWLQRPVHTLRVFEANRVSEILSVVPIGCWGHVSTLENPADVASRGCTPRELFNNSIWWNGPDWLYAPPSEWPRFLPAQESGKCMLAGELGDNNTYAPPQEGESVDEWTRRFSSMRTLLRTVVRLLRFREIIKPGPSLDRPITADDVMLAKNRCVRLVQQAYLPPELFLGKEIPKRFSALSPYCDEHGIVRVGGRLHNSPLAPVSRHPALLPRKCHFTNLIVDDIHQRHYHSGPSLTLALLRGEFWILGALKMIRGRIQQCVTCRIRKTKPSSPIMASLPKERFSQFRAFLQTGVDYAGPFLIKTSSRRNAAQEKTYLCLFVCMATKAVHLETVSSLTTTAFLSALDRFIARRGLPQTIHSDHGSNFIGASRFLKEVYTFISKNERAVLEHLAFRGVKWNFIPPHAPHFGGLWEAGVKSVKNLLTGSVGKQPHTFEELATIFTKVEGLLNSRPLCPLTGDSDNCDFLTPGHFLIGGPLSLIPESDENPPRSISSRWRMLHDQVRVIWDRWQREYLHTLQQRNKWRKPTLQLRPGDLVIMIERRSITGLWPVGRVVRTHPGKDGTTRVVTLRTPSGGTLVRAAHTLAPLFAPESLEAS